MASGEGAASAADHEPGGPMGPLMPVVLVTWGLVGIQVKGGVGTVLMRTWGLWGFWSRNGAWGVGILRSMAGI